MLIDRFGNNVERVVEEEPIVEHVEYDTNRPVRPGFEKYFCELTESENVGIISYDEFVKKYGEQSLLYSTEKITKNHNIIECTPYLRIASMYLYNLNTLKINGRQIIPTEVKYSSNTRNNNETCEEVFVTIRCYSMNGQSNNSIKINKVVRSSKIYVYDPKEYKITKYLSYKNGELVDDKFDKRYIDDIYCIDYNDCESKSKIKEIISCKNIKFEITIEFDGDSDDINEYLNDIDEMSDYISEYVLNSNSDEFIEEEYQMFVEAKINAAERNELDDDDFGLVYTDEDGKKVRKYPLTDKQHVLQAVRFFGDCPDEYKPLLAHNILKRAKKFDMDTSNWDKIHEWDKKYSDTLEEYAIFTEEKISTKERNELKDSEFGIPELRKYPLTDKTHVEQAVKMFGYCPPKYKKSLARRILSKAHKFGIDTSGWDSLKKVLND